jgi:spore maturation protein CgeB
MKKYKILRITHIFGKNSGVFFDSKNICAGDKNYKESIGAISESSMDISNSLALEIMKFGHNVETVYFDLKELQMLWAKENNCHTGNEDWVEQILLEQINKIKPDIIFFQKAMPLKKKTIVNLKRKFPFIRKIVFHTAYLGTTWGGQAVDHLLVGTPSLVQRYKKLGLKPRLFYHYFDPNINTKLKKTLGFFERKYALTFVGCSGYGGGFLHANRYFFLKHLLENTDIMMWVLEENNSKTNKKTIKQKLREIIKVMVSKLPMHFFDLNFSNKNWSDLFLEIKHEKRFFNNGGNIPSLKLKDLHPLRCYDSVHGLDYYGVLAESKISFTKAGNNIYNPEDSKIGDIGALRLFEATGLGSCLVADTGANMSELFEEGKEIITYTTKEDAVEKIKYLLENKEKTNEIAEAGKQRTFRCHLAKNRAQEFNDMISSD